LPDTQVGPGLGLTVFRVFDGLADGPVSTCDDADHPIRRGTNQAFSGNCDMRMHTPKSATTSIPSQ
jgi:hypothetical protein